MIQKYKSLLLVWVLAFLQCLVPLLHAHAGGLHASGTAHVHVHFEGLKVGAADAVEFHVDQSEMPSVGVPAEFRRDQFFSGDAPLPVVVQPVLPVPALEHVLAHIAPPSCHPCFHRLTPPAQAPPAVSRFL